MDEGELTQDEFVDLAKQIFGASWRDEVAQKLGISRKHLVLKLAGGEKVPPEICAPFVSIIDDHLRQRKAEQDRIEARLKRIRRKQAQ